MVVMASLPLDDKPVCQRNNQRHSQCSKSKPCRRL